MSTKNIYRPQTKIDYSTYLYILPAFIFYIIFVLFPLADTFFNSFTQWNGISEKSAIPVLNASYVTILIRTRVNNQIIENQYYIKFLLSPVIKSPDNSFD